MNGYITTRDLILHPWLILSEFGVRVYARALSRVATGHGHATFLECL